MAARGSGKGGYDCAFVSPLPKHLECPICLLIVREPHLTDCCGNHYYCRVCIERIQSEGKPCPLCNHGAFRVFPHKGVKREVEALRVYCPMRAFGCGWTGELRQMNDHVSRENVSGCGFVQSACGYCGECFQRRLLAAHQTDECPMRPLEVQLASMMKTMQQILKDNAALRAANRLLREEMRAMESRFTPVPPFRFSINNYQHCLRNDMYYYSPPFYSHVGGYKMCVKVYPNGFGDGRKSHLSLYVAIMKGEYDKSLRWPFRGGITCGLRKSGNSGVFHCRTVTFDGDTPRECCCKPEGCVTLKAHGYTRFLPNEEVSKFSTIELLRFTVLKVEVFSL